MWPNPQETADLATFTEEIINGIFIFCAVCFKAFSYYSHLKIHQNFDALMEVFHNSISKFVFQGIDDVTGEPLMQREDDKVRYPCLL